MPTNCSASETRCSNNLNRLQLLLLNTLQNVISICHKYGIPYYLNEGSCLGAIRHKGFIPWDDDMDIAIPASLRREFEYVMEHELSPRYKILKAFTAEGEEFCKIIDTGVELDGGLYDDAEHTYPTIDVCLLLGMPNNIIHRYSHYCFLRVVQKIYKASNPDKIMNHKRGPIAAFAVNVVKSIGKIPFLDKDGSKKKLQQAMYRYSMEDTSYTFCFSWYGKKEIMPTSVYGIGRECDFEELTVHVPSKAEDYLTRLYGDYNVLPPEEERIGKHNLSFANA